MEKESARQNFLELGAEKTNTVIGADGAVSMVASAFGFPSVKDYVLTYKAEFRCSDIEDTGMVGLYFSKSFAKGLFGWHVPYSRNMAELGLGVDHRAKITSSSAFRLFMQSDASRSLITARGEALSEHASIIPLSARRQTAKGNIALVGDAAGQVKATTGGGIIYGCLCADILAKTISEGRPLAEYERRWRSSYGKDLGFHRIAHSYYSRHRPPANLQDPEDTRDGRLPWEIRRHGQPEPDAEAVPVQGPKRLTPIRGMKPAAWCAIWMSGCGKSPNPIITASENSTTSWTYLSISTVLSDLGWNIALIALA